MSGIMCKAKKGESHVESGSLHARSYIEKVTAVLRRLDSEAVGRVIDLFVQARDRGSTIFFLETGGVRRQLHILPTISGSGLRLKGRPRFEPFV